MRNYDDRVEAAYMASKRQGDMMRDREEERDPHNDRRNRYLENDFRSAGPDVRDTRPHRQTMDTYQPRGASEMESGEGSYRGKGPKNYQRSDARINELVCDLLWDDPEIDASDVEVDVKDSEVILSGQVNEKYEKRLAEELAEQITGVSNVQNRIRVRQQAAMAR